MAAVYLRDAMSRVEVSSRTVLAACAEGDSLRANMAVLRRFAERPSDEARTSRLEFADLQLDEDTHEVWKAGRLVSLSPTEFKLLRYLMLNARRVLSKAQILDHVWQYDFGGDGSIVETYISYLRKKVDQAEPRLIHTVRGVGYTLRPPG